MKKTRIILGTIIGLFLGGYQRYNRPLSIAIQDPGEEMFALPQRTLPSSWDMMDKVFQSKLEEIPSDSGWILIDEADKKLTYNNLKTIGVYTYGGSGEIISIDDRKITNILSGAELKGFIDYKLQQIDDMIKQHDIVVPEGSDYTVAIPSWVGPQAITRLGSAYAYSDCMAGRIDQCRNTYDILFRFSQKMKDGGTLVQTLIGSIMESIVLNHIKHLLQNDNIKYNVLKEMLQHEQYIGSEKVFQNAMKTEYQTYKNQISKMDIMNNWNATTMDVIHIIGSDIGNMGTLNKGIQTFLWFVLPKSCLFNQQQTDAMARYFYSQPMSGSEGFLKDTNLHDYWNGPIWSRPNMIGRIILDSIIPKLTGIHTRLQDMEKKYMNIIQ